MAKNAVKTKTKSGIPIGRQLIELIMLAYHSMRPVLLEGATGIGKSEIFAQAAAELGVRYINRDLSLMEAPDSAGLPIIISERLHYAYPHFLPSKWTGGGLMVFEELNRAPRHVQVPLLQLLTTGTLNDYVLPPGWLICAAINPAGENYSVDQLDAAHVSRFMNIAVVPDVRNWVDWGETAGLEPALLGFVRSTPDIFDGAFSNPRAWKYVDDILKAEANLRYSKETLFAAISGFVGRDLALAFLSYRERYSTEAIPPADQLLTNYRRFRSRIRNWGENGDTASLNSVTRTMMIYLQSPINKERVYSDPKMEKAFASLLEDLPAEFRAKFKRIA